MAARCDVLQAFRVLPVLLAVLAVPRAATAMHGLAAPGCPDSASPPFEEVGLLGGLITALASDGSHLYVGVGSHLLVLDANTPSGVPEGGSVSVSLPHTIEGAALPSPGIVAVLAEDVVYLVDTSEPETPRVVDAYEQRSPIRAIGAWNGALFLLGDLSVFLVDATDLGAVRQVATVDLPAPAKSNTKLVVGDGVLAVGGGFGSLVVYDVTRPEAPLLIGGVEDGLEVKKIAASGRMVYVIHGADLFDDDGNRLVGIVAYVLEVASDNRLVKHGYVDLVPHACPGRVHGCGRRR